MTTEPISEELAKEAMRILIRFAEETGMVGCHLGVGKSFEWDYTKMCNCAWCAEQLNNN